jgi:hypothetical protein
VRPAPLYALLSLCLLVTTTGAASPAFAQTGNGNKGAPPPKSDEASEHFRSGVGFYKDRDFTAAMVEFKRAYELAPNYRVLYNLGQTARELRDYAAALSAFERYLSEGGAEVAVARRKEVTASIDELKKKVGKVKVTTNVTGAEITVDDAAVGVAPLGEPVVLNVGKHKLGASASGYTPVQRVVEIAGSSEDAVTLELTKVDVLAPPVAGPNDPPQVPIEPVKTKTPRSVWIMGGVTVASGVVTGVMGGLSLSARSSLNKALGTFPGDGTAISDAQKRTKTFALVTDVAAGVTLASAVTTVVLYLVAPRSPEKPAPAATVGISPSGISVQGSF